MTYKKFAFIAFTLLFSILFIAAVQYSGGPPPSRTGAPNEQNCTACHFGTVNSGTGSVEVTIENGLTTYEPSKTYIVTITVSQESITRFGFEITSLDETNLMQGEFKKLDNQVQIVSGNVLGKQRKYAQHTASGNSAATPGSKTWTIEWTAPSADVGDITFYVAGLAANKNGNTSGDKVYTSNLTITPVPMSLNEITITDASASSFCAGDVLSIDYKATGDYDPSNTFAVELSDEIGSFNSPLVIGELVSTTSGMINATIPTDITAGNAYRFRVVASSPQVMSKDNGSDKGIGNPEKPIIEISPEGDSLFVTSSTNNIEWYLNDMLLPFSQGMMKIKPSESGIYKISFTDEYGCVIESDTIDFILTSRTNLFAQQGTIELFPNPANEYISFEINTNIEKVEIYNNIGRLIYSDNQLKSTNNQFRINTSDFSSGIYFLNLTTIDQRNQQVFKFIVE